MSLQLLSLQDQGFEAGTGDWVLQTNCTIAQTAAQAHTGTKALALTSSAGGTMSAITGLVPIGPGRTINWSAWFRSAVSARACVISAYYFQSDGSTASVIRANDDATLAADSNSAWLQSAIGSAVVPLDAFYVKIRAQVTATGAGAEVHYVDDVSLLDTGAPYFKHGRTAALWLGGQDVSAYFASAEWAAKVATADVSVFQNTWKQYIAGQGESTFVASGFYDSALTAVRATFQQVPPIPAITYVPSSTPAIGDQARLISANTTDYKEGSKIGGAVTMDWTAQSSTIPDWGAVVHVMQPENPGTVTGTGDPLLQGIPTTTGAVAHLHVTIAGGTQNFKLQDAIALNGVYADITGGAFTAISSAGYQRLVIPGTIRAYVRCLATIATGACTYAVAVART